MRRGIAVSVGVCMGLVALTATNYEALIQFCIEAWELIGPGGKLHPTTFLEHKGHLFIESLLLVAILYLLLLPKTKPKHREALSEQVKPIHRSFSFYCIKEIDELCKEWQPEPLVPQIDPSENVADMIVERQMGSHVVIDGKQFLSMEGTDFLSCLSKPEIQEICRKSIEKYGVGSCGPRAFYGTMDVHLHLESHLASFFGVQESIVYSFDISTVPSVLPAYANRKDVIVVDESVHYPIQNGCALSRAQIRTFKHNDMEDLERVLIEIDKVHKKQRKPLNRRFIVVEGIYHSRGDVAPLKEIFRLKEKYKYRLIVDESLGFGVLGQRGRGVCEAFGLEPHQVDIVTASMSNALASVGGFCVGRRDVIGHQRLNGAGYIFSASLPPFLAVAANEALSFLEKAPKEMQKLRDLAKFARNELNSIEGLSVIGTGELNDVSPMIHLQFSNTTLDGETIRKRLTSIATYLREKSGIIVSVPKCTGHEWMTPDPTLRMIITTSHSKSDLTALKEALIHAMKDVD